MKLRQLNESTNECEIAVTRDRGDFTQIKKMGGCRPAVTDLVMVARVGPDIKGYMITKPYRKTAYTKRCGCDPEYPDLLEKLLQATMDKCKDLGFEYNTSRATDDELKALFDRMYGDPYKTQEFKHKTANRYRTNLSELGTERRVQRAGPDYNSGAPKGAQISRPDRDWG